MAYTKKENGRYIVGNIGHSKEWEKIEKDSDGNITSPQGLVEQIANEKELELKENINKAISKMLDEKAKELRYDNMVSARSYAGFENAFQEEAQKLSSWCALCWQKAGEIEDSVDSVEEVLELMPKY
jgi:type IV secretory pathway VirB4 component